MSDIPLVTPSESQYLRCPVPGQQNTVVAQQGVPSVIDFTFRDRSGNPLDLSRWFQKKCQQLPANVPVPLDDVDADLSLPEEEFVELPEVETSEFCPRCDE